MGNEVFFPILKKSHKEERFPLTFLFFQSLMNTILSGIVCGIYKFFIQNRIFNWKLLKPLLFVGFLTGEKHLCF
jgi:hypothetical protein